MNARPLDVIYDMELIDHAEIEHEPAFTSPTEALAMLEDRHRMLELELFRLVGQRMTLLQQLRGIKDTTARLRDELAQLDKVLGHG